MKNIFILQFLFLSMFYTINPCKSEIIDNKLKKLIIVTDPEQAQVFVNGNLKGESPIMVELSISDTTVNVLLHKKKYVDENISVNIKSTRTHRIYRELKIEGKIFINSQPTNASVFLDKKFKGKTPLEINQVPEGEHFMELELGGYQKFKSFIEILPKKKQILHNFRPKEGEISISGYPDNADIYLNDVFIGNSPISNEDVNYGKYTLLAEKPGYFSFEKNINMSQEKKQLKFEFDLKPKNINHSLLYSALFPGAGQYYSGRKIAGAIYASIGLGGVIYSSILYNNFSKSENNYNTEKKNYENAIDPIELEKLFNSMKDKHNTMKNKEKLFQNSLLYFSGLWLINMVDVYFLYPDTENPKVRLNVNPDTIQLNTTINF